MANLYENISDFWTSDEEVDYEPSANELTLDNSRQGIKETERSDDPLDFSNAFVNPLDSISWVPLLNQDEKISDPFHILDRDDNDDIFNVDVDLLERQLFGETMQYDEDAFDLTVAGTANDLDARCRVSSALQRIHEDDVMAADGSLQPGLDLQDGMLDGMLFKTGYIIVLEDFWFSICSILVHSTVHI